MINWNSGEIFVSGGKLGLTGEQIVRLKVSDFILEMILVLNDGELESYIFDPSKNEGFSQTDIADSIKAEGDKWVPSGKIVEIAGGKTVKLRYSNGTCVEVSLSESLYLDSTVYDDVARVTQNAIYYQARKYYKSGPGSSPLMPYLSTVPKDKNGNIIAVFEGDGADKVITIDDLGASTDPIIGALGDMLVTSGSDGMTLHTPGGGTVVIDGYGLLMRKNDPVTTFVQTRSAPYGTDPNSLNWGSIFCPDQEQYNQAHSSVGKSGWAGFGKTGNVVESQEDFSRKVSAVVSSPYIDEKIPVVIQGGSLKKVNGDGTLAALQTTNLAGAELIEFVFNNDMSGIYAVADGLQEIEPFCVNGFSFGYSGGRWAKASPQQAN
jgi:hypothetical protein